MTVLLIYARMYADCLRQAIHGIKNNVWTVLLPTGLNLAWTYLAALVAPLRLVGGFLVGLIMAALASCYLYFVSEIVSHSKVTTAELKRSFGVYFWSILNLFFVIWVAQMLLGYALGGSTNGSYFVLGLELIALVLLNAAPESIYLKGTYGGLATIQRSIAFIQEHWIEWLLPTALLAAILIAVPYAFPYSTLGVLATMVIRGVLIHLGMLFRGHLYAALDQSTHRQRMFKYRSL